MEVTLSPENVESVAQMCECCGNHPAVLSIACEETLTSANVCVNCIGSAFLMSFEYLQNAKDEEGMMREVKRCSEVIFNEISGILMGAVKEQRNKNHATQN